MQGISVYTLIPFVSFIVNMTLTVYIFAKRRESEINYAYFYFSLSVTGWTFIDFVLWSHVLFPWSYPILKIGAIFWHSAPFTFLYFVYVFLKRNFDRLFYILLALAGFSLLLTLSTDWIINGARTISTAVIDGPGFLHTPASLLGGMLPAWVGLILMSRQYQKSNDRFMRIQILWVAGGTLLGGLITISTMVLIPDVLHIEGVLPLNDVGFLINSIFILIAVKKYKFMSLSVSDVADELFSSMSDGIVILSHDERIQHINFAAIQMLGLQAHDIRRPDFRVDACFTDYPKDKSEFHHIELTRNDGAESQFYDVSRAHVRLSNEENATIFTIRDITRRKQAELDLMQAIKELEEARDQALEANRMKSQFLANMSHELRTPLNAVIGYSEIIGEEALESGEEQMAHDANKINAAGKHLLSLINDILDLSKIEAGKMQLYVEPFVVKDMVQAIVSVVEPLIKNNDNQLVVDDVADGLSMISDQTKVRQIIFNFISNAAKFTQHGKIKLKIKSEGETIRFAVEDSGIGIPEDKIESLFDAFTQADASTTRKYGGTGLGLAICQNFAQILGGRVEVYSREGVGSEFSVTLPLEIRVNQQEAMQVVQTIVDNTVEAKGRNVGSANEASSRRQKISKVLVIDDDPHVCDLVSRSLSKAGFDVLIANSGEEGLLMAQEYLPDVITLDVMMPNMDGWTVLHTIRSDEQLQNIPVIMLSMVDDKDIGFALGAAEYMVKPVNTEQLLGMVRKSVRKSQGRILIVEDDLAAQSITQAALQKQGFQVQVADNGRQALDILARDMPDIIITDLMMPSMDGFELVRELRSREDYKQIPIIVLSAMELDNDERKQLTQLVEEIVAKNSMPIEALVEKIRYHLTEVDTH